MFFGITEVISKTDRIFLENVYRTYHPMLNKLVVGIVNDSTLSEDVITNAMMSLFSKIPFLSSLNDQNLIAYLRTTVRNAAYKQYNAQKHKNATELPLDHDILFSLPSQTAALDDLLIQDEDFHQVREAIGALPPNDRRLLYLKYGVQLTTREITELTGAHSEAVTRAQLSRARRRLLDSLNNGEVGECLVSEN